MFKEKANINQKNMNAYGENLRLLADALRANEEQPGRLREFLLDGIEKEDKRRHPSHEICSGCKSKDGKDPKTTEKRLCRCMYYYNHQSQRQQGQCSGCDFKRKRTNTGDYQVCDYEVPMDEKWVKVGGVDLILKRKDENTYYGVEVKPASSKETLVRMAAEILTYGEINRYQGNSIGNRRISYKPGICFFEESNQHKDYLEFTGVRPFHQKTSNPEELMADFREILSYINVFLIKCDDKTFQIERIHSADKDITAL